MSDKKRWQYLAGILKEQVSELDLAKVRKKAEWIKDTPNTPRSWNQIFVDIKNMIKGEEIELRDSVYSDWSDRELEALLNELGDERAPGPGDVKNVGHKLRSMAGMDEGTVPNLEAILKEGNEGMTSDKLAHMVARNLPEWVVVSYSVSKTGSTRMHLDIDGQKFLLTIHGDNT